jgi:hypothetical protein
MFPPYYAKSNCFTHNAVYERAHAISKRTGKSIETILADWIKRLADETPLEWLSDKEILDLADAMLPQPEQEELNELLALNSEGQINEKQMLRLDELMEIYHRLLVRKAEATAVAVERGLREPLAS